MKFLLCYEDKVISEVQNDLVRFTDEGTNVDPIGFLVSKADVFNCVKCRIGMAKIHQKIAVKGELWFTPFSLKFEDAKERSKRNGNTKTLDSDFDYSQPGRKVSSPDEDSASTSPR